MTKKALFIGNNAYNTNSLDHGINDAEVVAECLSRNENGSVNFTAQMGTDLDAAKMKAAVTKLFSGEGDIALFYFSGHGSAGNFSGAIVGTDGKPLPLCDIMRLANASHFRHKIIILDCCHAGYIANTATAAPQLRQPLATLAPGVTILAACRDSETAAENQDLKHGLFTSLLLDALEGGAANLMGDITPGAIYAYIDRSLGPWEQRPVFKTHVDSFCSLKKTKPFIAPELLRELPKLFPQAASYHELNPSYEFTNSPTYSQELKEPYADSENIHLFESLQQLARAGLVVPHGEKHMYFAAMNSKSCKLTPLGMHYWHLAKDNRI